MHHHREEAYQFSKKPLEGCHVGFFTALHDSVSYLCGSSVSDLIGSMDHHIHVHNVEMIQKHCRVSVNLLDLSYREKEKGILPML